MNVPQLVAKVPKRFWTSIREGKIWDVFAFILFLGHQAMLNAIAIYRVKKLLDFIKNILMTVFLFLGELSL